MKIFVNDKPLEILNYEELDSSKSFEHSYQNLDEIPEDVEWDEDVIFHEPSQDLVIRLLYLMRTRKMKKLDSVTLVTHDKKALKEFVKSRFLIIKAAGGIVSKKDKILMIYRLGKWDFPKGKFDKGETPEECAKREVEEECNVKVKIDSHICNTWHTYTQNRRSILKKTYWYAMDCINDSGMKPQVEEGIDEILWLSEGDAKTALINSYPSMRYLFKQYLLNHLKSQIL
ncbi:MAG: NUDIX hydrolase [Algoriphagus aquaeductus]|jgi:8-oxo-(d)GTP phosphatase|uniref:ADP-ribose pyrophosphatase YjhB (NUDIX family) n=1 Tax=Algoriphagus aquaeductus TaxID=475299 RepID=A0A326RZS1_9BACT|nr:MULTISPECIES: NUDIX domain-containing protein [Algoriphagus]PZV87494.1 ADP-ribose pyrophosphatase YjhB (NUDIX family) [Algoriphagus aquaeductus]